MEKYIIRWQELVNGRYQFRYLGRFEIKHSLEIDIEILASRVAAIRLPEAVAEWICELLDTQYDLNPEMVRVEG